VLRDLEFIGLELRCWDKSVFVVEGEMVVQEFSVNETAFIFTGTVKEGVGITRCFLIGKQILELFDGKTIST
jgi:hypothetical protein